MVKLIETKNHRLGDLEKIIPELTARQEVVIEESEEFQLVQLVKDQTGTTQSVLFKSQSEGETSVSLLSLTTGKATTLWQGREEKEEIYFYNEEVGLLKMNQDQDTKSVALLQNNLWRTIGTIETKNDYVITVLKEGIVYLGKESRSVSILSYEGKKRDIYVTPKDLGIKRAIYVCNSQKSSFTGLFIESGDIGERTYMLAQLDGTIKNKIDKWSLSNESLGDMIVTNAGLITSGYYDYYTDNEGHLFFPFKNFKEKVWSKEFYFKKIRSIKENPTGFVIEEVDESDNQITLWFSNNKRTQKTALYTSYVPIEQYSFCRKGLLIEGKDNWYNSVLRLIGVDWNNLL